MGASRRGGTTDASVPDEPERDSGTRAGRDVDGADLLAALLDGMDAALCAFDAHGVVTHWNREAERVLGWSAAEAVGRQGLAGWAVRQEDAAEVEGRLTSAMHAAGRQVHEFALLTKDGRRVLVRTQCAGVPGPDGKPAGLYCAFSEVHTQMDLERSIALSEALFDDASWGVVLVDADLRPAMVNAYAARALGTGRTAALGRPLGELLGQGVEDLEAALTHVLGEGAPPAPAEIWVTVRTPEGERRRCWRNGFVRLASPLAEEPVPLGVGWLFHDVTEARQGEQEAALLRFRASQLHRAARAAAECEDPAEAATVHLDFALAGFADHALIDRVAEPPDGAGTGASTGPDTGRGIGTGADPAPVRLVRVAATPAGSPGPSELAGQAGLPVRYGAGHPAVRCVERCGSVRAGAGGSGARPAGEGPAPGKTAGTGHPGTRTGTGQADTGQSGTGRTGAGQSGAGSADGAPAGAVRAGAGAVDPEQARRWALERQWPADAVHALCAVLRSRGRTLGVVTFLRSAGRGPFERADAVYAEDVAVRIAALLDLVEETRRSR